MRRSLEDLLLEEGLLDHAALRQARHSARQRGVSLARAAVELGLSDERLAETVARELGLPRVDLQREPVDGDAVREVPHDLAESRRLLPLSIDRESPRRSIRVAMADPLDFDALEEIEIATGCFVDPVVARASELAEAVERHYRGIITKMIPRSTASEAAREPGWEVWLRALTELLVERGMVDRAALEDLVRRLGRADGSE